MLSVRSERARSTPHSSRAINGAWVATHTTRIEDFRTMKIVIKEIEFTKIADALVALAKNQSYLFKNLENIKQMALHVLLIVLKYN